jgi:hypothetical protein
MKSFLPNTVIQNDFFPLKSMEMEAGPESSVTAVKTLVRLQDGNAS